MSAETGCRVADSTSVSTPMVSVKTSTAAPASAGQRRRTRAKVLAVDGWRRFGSGRPTTDGPPSAVRRPAARRRSRSLVRRSEALYTADPTVAITLATAAPIIVPATPNEDETTAADTAASAEPST